MLESIWYVFVAVVCLVSVSNWRAGVFAIIVLDVLRDPIRKMESGNPVWITVSVNAVWAAVFVGAASNNKALRRLLYERPRLRAVLHLLFISLTPGAMLSVFFYNQGWLIAAVGAISYIAPLIGIPIGFAFAANPQSVFRLLKFYCVVNSLALGTVFLEYYGVKHEVLGGMNMEWIRHQHGYVVNLIAGVYRSPDVMGLHAAFVASFIGILLISRSQSFRLAWIGVAVFAGLCLLISGRRKMIGIPFAFAAAVLILSSFRRSGSASRMRVSVSIVLLIAAAVLFGSRELEVGVEYVDYASTLFTQGAARANDLIGGSVISTLAQSGVLGKGLGTATQGRYHVSGNTGRSWQEDGISRLFAELGIPGLFFVAAAVFVFLGQLSRVWHDVLSPSEAERLMVGMLAFVFANLASFAISHQVYTGDPCSALFVSFALGVVFSCPGLSRSGLSRPTWGVSGSGQRLRAPEGGIGNVMNRAPS